MPYVDRQGIRIYYETRGAGPAILFTHGYGATLRMWDRQVDTFADQYRLITWDMRGHGQSDSPEDPSAYSHDATVADMAALLDACSVDAAVVAGLSLGGFVSLAFYLAYPERVRALVLCATGPGYKKTTAREAWNRFAEESARALETRGLATLGSGAEVFVAAHRSAQGLAHAARGMLAQQNARVIESLPDIMVPTLVVAGANDTPFLASTNYMAERIPHATKVIIDGAGHAPNIEKPEAFDDALSSFLDSLTGV